MTTETYADRQSEGIALSPRERVLQAAEACFMARGYAAVTLRDIAAEVGIKHASLYHHVPGGKEELFVEVVERSLARHRAGIEEQLRQVPPRIRDQLHAISDWFLGQSPMDLVRMTQSDMPALSPETARSLAQLTHQSILVPVEQILCAAYERGELKNPDAGLLAGGIVGLVQSLFSVPEHAVRMSRHEMGRRLIDALLDGIGPDPSAS